jgi:hypothetical protein
MLVSREEGRLRIELACNDDLAMGKTLAALVPVLNEVAAEAAKDAPLKDQIVQLTEQNAALRQEIDLLYKELAAFKVETTDLIPRATPRGE